MLLGIYWAAGVPLKCLLVYVTETAQEAPGRGDANNTSALVSTGPTCENISCCSHFLIAGVAALHAGALRTGRACLPLLRECSAPDEFKPSPTPQWGSR